MSIRKLLLPLGFALLLLTLPFSAPQALAQETAPNIASSEAIKNIPNKPQFSLGAKEIAQNIGIMPLIDKLYSLPPEELGLNGGTMSLQALTLRQRILEAVVASSLETDGILAEIDNEIAITNEHRAALEAKRDRTLAINNVVNFVTSGAFGVLSGALAYKESTANWANAAGILSGSSSIILSAIGIKQQHGKAAPLGVAPNMLAKILDRDPEFHSDYPKNILLYLNSVAPLEMSQHTRKELLIKQWLDVGRIDSLDSKKGQNKIALLTSGVSQQVPVSIDVLMDRAAMLDDLRAQISLIKRDLSKLMLTIKAN